MVHNGASLQIGTPEYDQEYEAVKLYGYKNSTARNPYQQETPYFWADDVSECDFSVILSHPPAGSISASPCITMPALAYLH